MQALVIRLYKIEKMGAPSLYTLSFNICQLKRAFPGEHKIPVIQGHTTP
jgi:hypothetical protein